MATLKNVTREALLKTMAEYDRLGEDAFHAKHGTSPSKLMIPHGGKSYPSKAMVVVAAGLSPKDVSGGFARLGGLLSRCGFELAQIAFGFAAAFASMAAPSQPADSIQSSGQHAIYFASGSSRASDIRGFAAIGHAIGVAADEVSPAAEDELYRLAGSGVPVFVDSGAFSEVEFDPSIGGFRVERPISASSWQDRVDLLSRLAAVYEAHDAAGDLYVVAPDMVGNQDETLVRLARWKNEMRALHDHGVRVLVCIQKGALSQADFDAQICEVLGFSDYVRAMPCKKGATTPAELLAFTQERKPARVHLLGLGVANRAIGEYLDAVREGNGDAIVTLDSNKIAASVGRGGKKPRILTAARDIARGLIEAGKTVIKNIQELGIILAWGSGFQLDLSIA